MVAYYSLEIMPTKRNMCEYNYSMEDSSFLVFKKLVLHSLKSATTKKEENLYQQITVPLSRICSFKLDLARERQNHGLSAPFVAVSSDRLEYCKRTLKYHRLNLKIGPNITSYLHC